MFNAVTENDFLKVDKGKLKQGNKILDQTQVMQFSHEARTLQKLGLFKKLMDTMRFAANEKMYTKSQNIDDVIFGKALLWAIYVLENKVHAIAQLDERAGITKDPEFKPLNKKKK